MERVLIVGGAGFIGSHLAKLFLENDYAVRVIDRLLPQVHGESGLPPPYLSPDVEFLRGDVRDLSAMERAVDYYLDTFASFSDLQEAKPRPLAELEAGPLP
jgi:dTDP-L-rhamnose 4-epimerase